MAGEITQDGSRIVYENPWLRLREDDVTFPNGHQSIYTVVEKCNFVAVLPVDEEGRIHLVSQYRYPVGQRTWEIPQGSWPHRPEATPEEVARGELKEETGFTAAKMEYLGELFQAPGLIAQHFHAFLATGLTAGETEREVTESDMEAGAFTLAELRAMIADGRVKDATSLSVLGLLAMQGRLGELG